MRPPLSLQVTFARAAFAVVVLSAQDEALRADGTSSSKELARQPASPSAETGLPAESGLPGTAEGRPEKALPRPELVVAHNASIQLRDAGQGGQTESLAGKWEAPADASDETGVTAPFSLRDMSDHRSFHRPPPWVHASELGLPTFYEESAVERSPLELSPWALFTEKLDLRHAATTFESRRQFDGIALFQVEPARESEFARKLKKVVSERAHREIRRHARRQWKSEFRDHPSLSYAEYERRLVQINNVGKDASERDYFNVEYTSNEVKQGLLRKERTDAESDLPLVTWGPVTVTDSASVKFDLGTAAHAESEDTDIDVGAERRKPLFRGKGYELDTSIIADVNPLRGYAKSDATMMVRRFGVEVKVDWLTDVLSRRTVSAEFECTADLEGDFGVFANFIVYSR